jgi:hypothetical protein
MLCDISDVQLQLRPKVTHVIVANLIIATTNESPYVANVVPETGVGSGMHAHAFVRRTCTARLAIFGHKAYTNASFGTFWVFRGR